VRAGTTPEGEERCSNLVPGEGGNTSHPSPAVHWCFTLNNPEKEDFAEICSIGSNCSKVLIMQEETGENGTPHIQGYFAFKKKIRPKNLFNRKIHWEKCRNPSAAREYCQKDDTRTGRRCRMMDGKEAMIRSLEDKFEPYPWQQEVIDLVRTEPDKRSIHWFWEKDGGTGKSTLCKHIVKKFNAIMVTGKAADMKCAIAKRFEVTGAGYDVVIVNLPRSFNKEYLSYTGLEEIKDGLFFSGKYESGMVITDCPHLIVFANEPPDTSKMSADRWVIKNLGGIPPQTPALDGGCAPIPPER